MGEHLADGFAVCTKGNTDVAMQQKQDSVSPFAPRGCGRLFALGAMFGAICAGALACFTNSLGTVFTSSHLCRFFGAVPSAYFTGEGLVNTPN